MTHREGAQIAGVALQQLMRVAAFFAQGQTLCDPEAMLLIDDGQAQAGEIHAILDQGMGADPAAAANCSRFVLLFKLPESQATLTPSGSSQAESFR